MSWKRPTPVRLACMASATVSGDASGDARDILSRTRPVRIAFSAATAAMRSVSALLARAARAADRAHHAR